MRWMTPAEAAEYAACGMNEIYEGIRTGALDGRVKPWSKSKLYYITSQEAVDEWVQSFPTYQEFLEMRAAKKAE